MHSEESLNCPWPDPSGLTLCVWDCSCFTLPSCGTLTPWAGSAASQSLSFSVPHVAGVADRVHHYLYVVWASVTGERRGHCAVLNLTLIQMSSKSVMSWSMYTRCHHVSWHKVLERKRRRTQEAECPPPLSSNSAHQVSLFHSAIACPLQIGGRKESLFPSAGAYTETQCFSSLWINCYVHNPLGMRNKDINENNNMCQKARFPWNFHASYQRCWTVPHSAFHWHLPVMNAQDIWKGERSDSCFGNLYDSCFGSV